MFWVIHICTPRMQLQSLWKVVLHASSTFSLLPQVDTSNYWFVLYCILSLLDLRHVFLSFSPQRLLKEEEGKRGLKDFLCFDNPDEGGI